MPQIKPTSRPHARERKSFRLAKLRLAHFVCLLVCLFLFSPLLLLRLFLFLIPPLCLSAPPHPPMSKSAPVRRNMCVIVAPSACFIVHSSTSQEPPLISPVSESPQHRLPHTLPPQHTHTQPPSPLPPLPACLPAFLNAFLLRAAALCPSDSAAFATSSFIIPTGINGSLFFFSPRRHPHQRFFFFPFLSSTRRTSRPVENDLNERQIPGIRHERPGGRLNRPEHLSRE